MKIQNLSSTVSPFAGISFANYSFNKTWISQLIDNELGKRVKTTGLSYSEIIRNLTNVIFCGGDVIEDISSHLGEHLKMIPSNNIQICLKTYTDVKHHPHMEGLSISLLEAMSYGKTCIVNDFGLPFSNYEVYIMSNNDPKTIANAIKFFNNNENRVTVLGDNARK